MLVPFRITAIDIKDGLDWAMGAGLNPHLRRYLASRQLAYSIAKVACEPAQNENWRENSGQAADEEAVPACRRCLGCSHR